MILNYPVFEDDQSIVAKFFGRQGGVSSGVYSSLNCGVGSGDDAACVRENRARVMAEIGCDQLLGLYQVHGATCLRVDAPWAEGDRPQADAFVTDVAGIGLGVLTADCAPVLFYAQGAGGPVIGAAHAGWRGALGGILGATVDVMRGYDGVDAVQAVIGPCIGKKSYEVSEDFIKPFLEQSDVYEQFFSAAPSYGKLLFDLGGFCALRLAEAGVRSVTVMDQDTYAGDDAFFSYRRMTHAGEPDYGRQIAVIAIA